MCLDVGEVQLVGGGTSRRGGHKVAVRKVLVAAAAAVTINETMIGLRVARLTQLSTTKQSQEIKLNPDLRKQESSNCINSI